MAAFRQHVQVSDVAKLCSRAEQGEDLKEVLSGAEAVRGDPEALIAIARSAALKSPIAKREQNLDSSSDSDNYISDGDFLDEEFNSQAFLFCSVYEHASPEVKKIKRFIIDLFFLQMDYFERLCITGMLVQNYETKHYLLERLGKADLLNDKTVESRDFLIRANQYCRKKIVNINGISQLVDDPEKEEIYPQKVIELRDVELTGESSYGTILSNDRELLLSFASHDCDVLDYASVGLFSDGEFILRCVENYGLRSLEFLDRGRSDVDFALRRQWLNDPGIIKAAVLGPPRLQDRARIISRNYYGGKRIGDYEAMQYAGGWVNQDPDLIFEITLELSKRFGRRIIDWWWRYRCKSVFRSKYTHIQFMHAVARLRRERNTTRLISRSFNLPEDVEGHLQRMLGGNSGIEQVCALGLISHRQLKKIQRKRARKRARTRAREATD